MALNHQPESKGRYETNVFSIPTSALENVIVIRNGNARA